MKLRNFIAIILSIALMLGFLIYWREYEFREQVAFYLVVLWQLCIWIPWIVGFKLLEYTIRKARQYKYNFLVVPTAGILWLCLHFGWFFFLSSNFSPYLDFPGSRYGVYRYFFIFWSLIDLGLIWFVIDKLNGAAKEESVQPLLIELTRGNTKYYCEPSEIYLLAADNYYTRLHTTQGVFVMRKPLKAFYEVLPRELFRKIHRSTIVNVNYVAELARDEDHHLEVVMKDGTRRRVSRNFVSDIIHYFKDRTS